MLVDVGNKVRSAQINPKYLHFGTQRFTDDAYN